MHRKRLLCWKAYLPRSSWPTQPTTPIICARPSLPKARSPSSPTTRHGRSNIRSTSISMPSAISWSAASQNSNNSAASQPASKRQPEITLPSSLSQPSSYGCDKCPHHLDFQAHNAKLPQPVIPLTVIPQGDRHETFFGMSWDMFTEPRLRPFTVEVTFLDLKKRKHVDAFVIDVSQFDGRITIGDHPEEELVKAAKDIAAEL